MTDAGSLDWTLLVDGPLSGAVNMARDASLTRMVSDAVEREGAKGDGVPACLRFYSWSRPTLSFGRNEPARDRFDRAALAAAGIDVVRRPTGGRAVLHHREVTYSVIVPDRALGGPRESYRSIHVAIAEGLARLGADVHLAPDGPAATPDAGPCFDLPSPGEVVARGRKLVGSAQARLGKALLQHGSILLHDDQSRIDDLARESGPPSAGGARTRPIALADLIDPPPSEAAVVASLIAAMAGTLPGRWPRRPAPPGGGTPGAPEVPDGMVAKFEHPDWTWRR